MNTQSGPYGQMPTALEALRALVIEFDSYAEDMRAIGRGHADYGLQRRLAHMVLHAAQTPDPTPEPTPEAPTRESAPEATTKAPTRARARQPKAVTPAKPIAEPIALADMKRDELYKHFKATAPIADLTFFLNATADTLPAADVDAAEALAELFDESGKLTINRAEYYRRLVTLQDHWRHGAAERWTRERATDRQNAATAEAWRHARHYDALACEAVADDLLTAA